MAKRPTVQEWLEAHPPKCKRCENLLAVFNFENFNNGKINKLKDVDGEKIKGLYCHHCVDEAHKDLMESRFLEEYKGEKIYQKDDMYLPYWGCMYHFKTLEECRIRIDASDTVVLPWGGTASRNRVREVLGVE